MHYFLQVVWLSLPLVKCAVTLSLKLYVHCTLTIYTKPSGNLLVVTSVVQYCCLEKKRNEKTG